VEALRAVVDAPGAANPLSLTARSPPDTDTVGAPRPDALAETEPAFEDKAPALESRLGGAMTAESYPASRRSCVSAESRA
jgi:hypothetical protein